MKGDFIGFRISTENNENPFVVKLFYLHLTNVNKIYCYFEAGYGMSGRKRKEVPEENRYFMHYSQLKIW